ncbi:MAG TPA: DUF1573 domain-containing protein [Puia sp.]|nr:DUF1573 domain-containing protein [Puia sp.]
MKRLFLFIAACGFAAFGFAQHNTADSVVKFNEKSYNFGKIQQHVTVNHNFAFTNISGTPLVIESAIASCGCTTPVKPEGAIANGKTDKIVAGFSAPALGPFNKTITVKFAGVNTPVQLTITGEVLSPEDYAKYKSQGGKSGS